MRSHAFLRPGQEKPLPLPFYIFGKRLFKESTGKTLQNFLMYYRMNQAAELLKVSGLTINEIGKRCGYQNQLHFSRAFKNIFGLSPMQWRKREKEEGEL